MLCYVVFSTLQQMEGEKGQSLCQDSIHTVTIHELFNYSHLYSVADAQGIYSIWLMRLLCPLMTSQQIMKHDFSCLAQSQTTLSLFVCWYHCNTLSGASCSSTRWRTVLDSAKYTTNLNTLLLFSTNLVSLSSILTRSFTQNLLTERINASVENMFMVKQY